MYVAPFPGPGGKWQISNAGGRFPRWNKGGSEIFYLALDNTLMAVPVNGKGSGFEVGAVTPLFQTRVPSTGGYQYDVSPDGQRFLVNMLAEEGPSPLVVVLNWTAGVPRQGGP